ncbi:thiopurine S-methyltransferase [Lacunimicrobium album]
MQPEFWHERWQRKETAFHEGTPNPFLVEHFAKLNLSPGSRVFVPLCGRTVDIHWLLSQGAQVAGAELSQLAIDQLFSDLGQSPIITPTGDLLQYSAPNIDIFVGNIFSLTPSLLGHIDAIYDRAALVALPQPIRDQYTTHLKALTSTAPQLLITFEYDQSQIDGPPFSINADEVQHHYASSYDITPLATHPIPNGLKGKCPASESTWLLNPRQADPAHLT